MSLVEFSMKKQLPRSVVPCSVIKSRRRYIPFTGQDGSLAGGAGSVLSALNLSVSDNREEVARFKISESESPRERTFLPSKKLEGKMGEMMDHIDEQVPCQGIFFQFQRPKKISITSSMREFIQKLASESPGFFRGVQKYRLPFEYGRKCSYSKGLRICICAAAPERQIFRVEISAVRNREVGNRY